MTDNEARDVIEQNVDRIEHTKRLLWPLVFCAICLLLDCCKVKVEIHFVFKLYICIFYLAFGGFIGKQLKIPVLYEIRNREKLKNSFFMSPEIPKCPPLCDGGLLYAKRLKRYEDGMPIYSEFSDPYLIKNARTYIGMDIDCNDVYKYTICIGDKTIISTKDVSNLGMYKEVLVEFEKLGYQVEAIKDKYGDYVWFRGEAETRSKFDKITSNIKLCLLDFVWFICNIAPVVWFLLH